MSNLSSEEVSLFPSAITLAVIILLNDISEGSVIRDNLAFSSVFP